MLQSMGSQRARHNLAPEQQQVKNVEENCTQVDWFNPFWKSSQSEEEKMENKIKMNVSILEDKRNSSDHCMYVNIENRFYNPY